jgi:23S rRNA (pseudouridine1915-N3)-methyltransferase
MMRVTVACVGRLKEAHWRGAAEEYVKRLRPYVTLEWAEVPDRDISRDEGSARSSEGDSLLRVLPAGAYTVALDEHGTERSSEELAAWLDDLAVRGTSHVAFMLGGSAGLDPRVLAAASERMSLSRMTFPHQLARVLLLEQLYRACRISRGEPYHH